ncbi:hypothetical protein ACLHDG_05980 [Sulfurovum sp. CS9]|uniref:hypothetical protein n=1 Tax=Sulfurovum sp. CS9 TaxID=3391146 RepID=UPI0039EA4626
MKRQNNKKLFIYTLFVWTTLNAHVDEKVLYAFEKACMSCHDTYEKNKIAPPLIAVNQVYLRLTDGNMTVAMERIKTFLAAPSKERTLMKPAVKLFGVMPKLELTEEEMRDYAQVLIETEFEIPEWFDEHYKTHELKKPQENNSSK